MPRPLNLPLRALAHAGALLPLALLAWGALRGDLTADPVREVVVRTGVYALALLVLSLSCTPVALVFSLPQVLQLRRPLGLYALLYTCLHLGVFVALDYTFDFATIWKDVLSKRFGLVGLASFLALVPLAGASLFREGWGSLPSRAQEWLHRLTYLAGLLAVAHFLLEVKADRREPLIWAAAVIVLLLVRLPWVKRAIAARHRQNSLKPIDKV